MAFHKIILHPNTGVAANYWRIGPVNINPVGQFAEVFLHGYTSQAVRHLPSGEHVDQRLFYIAREDFVRIAASIVDPNTTVFNALAKALYQHIKAAPQENGQPSEFADAEDV